MRPRKILKTFLIIISIVGFCFGQEITEDENWLKGLGTEADVFPSLIYPFTKFTEDDLARGKRRLNTVRKFAPKNEWEGIYSQGVFIGDVRLIWNSEGGFFNFYFYHYLKRFNYGTVNDSSSSVELVSEKLLLSSADKRQLAETKIKLVKVKFGNRRYLVPERHIRDFCERAVGLSTDLQDYSYYWMKVEDDEKEVFGLPILPSEYRHLLRNPIEAEITQFGKKKIISHKSEDGTVNYVEIHYPVTLNAGKNKDIKRGTNFYVENLGEWVEITKVFQKSSMGGIRRYYDEDNLEQCRDSELGQGETIPCKEFKIGMKARTKVSEYYF